MANTTLPASSPAASQRFTTFSHAVLFVLGFSLVFVIGWGGAATILGELFATYKSLLGTIGGVVVILFGLSTLGVLRLPFLSYELRPQWRMPSGGGLLPSVLMGIFFAAGWTPCIGTTLGAILTLGISDGKAGQAMLLSSGYALGLGLPFLALGLGVDRAVGVIGRFHRYIHAMEVVSGLFLIVIGVMMLTGQMFQIAIWAQRNGLFFDLPLGGDTVPTYLIAVVGGLISFVSPCVLPLVPAYLGYLSGQAVGGIRQAEG